MVVAAETGSGKTHSYLAPLISKLCDASVSPKINLSEKASSPPHRHGLVVCPNVLLCEQVVRMADGLYGENGEPLLQLHLPVVNQYC